MKILIGYPPTDSEKGVPLLSQNRQFQYFNNPTYLFPVSLATCATFLKSKGYQVIWKDAIAESISESEFFKFLKTEKPSFFMFETKAPVIKRHWKIINELKSNFPDMKIVICGDHVTAFPRETLQNSNVDYVINGGYFDFAVFDLLEAIKGGEKIPQGIWYRKDGEIIENERYVFKYKLDDAPIIDRILTRNDLYQREYNLVGRPFAYIMSARDCWWGRCTFCVWNMTLYSKGNFRARSPENVLEEVKYLVDKCGVKEIFDDAGTITVGNWLKRFCNLMIEGGYNKKVLYSCNMRFGAVDYETYKLMKKAGFRLLKFGLESGVQHTIDKLDKGTKIEEVEESCKLAKKAGLTVHLTMMVGYPWETKEDAKKTLKLAKHLMVKGYADVLQSTVIIPYPGTPLWYEGIEKGWFRFDPYEYERYDMREPVFSTPDMSPEEVTAICHNIYKNIFFSPEYILKHLTKIKSWDDIKYTGRGVKAVLGHLRDFNKKKLFKDAV